jgi:hypothetical protein
MLAGGSALLQEQGQHEAACFAGGKELMAAFSVLVKHVNSLGKGPLVGIFKELQQEYGGFWRWCLCRERENTDLTLHHTTLEPTLWRERERERERTC